MDDIMNNIFYFFRGLLILICTVSKILLKPLSLFLLPLILFLRNIFNSASNEELFENIFIESYLFYLILSVHIVLFAGLSVKAICILNQPSTVEGFWNKMIETHEINYILFFIYIQIFVIFSILLCYWICNSCIPYLVQLGKQGKCLKQQKGKS